MEIITREVSFIPEFDLHHIADPSGILLFDIETTGLSRERTQAYLIGCAYLEGDTWMIRQYLAENALDEASILEEFLEFAASFRTLVHFNGDGFDIPYLEYKADFYGFSFPLAGMESFDIWKHCRRFKKLLGLASLKQKSIEDFLGIERDDKLSGGLLIPCFYAYEKSGSQEQKDLLLLHNYDDIQGMLKILPVLEYDGLFDGDFSFSASEEFEGTWILAFRLQRPVPVPVHRDVPICREGGSDISVYAEGDLLQINLRIYETEARFPLPDYRDYYYLPEEDRVIHKDVAQFVDRSRRVRATKSNCFIRKESRFLPQYRPLFAPAFQVEGDKKRTYFELTEDFAADALQMRQFAMDILSR